MKATFPPDMTFPPVEIVALFFLCDATRTATRPAGPEGFSLSEPRGARLNSSISQLERYCPSYVARVKGLARISVLISQHFGATARPHLEMDSKYRRYPEPKEASRSAKAIDATLQLRSRALLVTVSNTHTE